MFGGEEWGSASAYNAKTFPMYEAANTHDNIRKVCITFLIPYKNMQQLEFCKIHVTKAYRNGAKSNYVKPLVILLEIFAGSI